VRLLRLAAWRLADGLRRASVAVEIGWQLRILLERPAGADGTLQDDARLRNGCGDDVRAAFIDGAAIARSKKPSDVWYVFI
jgi:hypothetical protein